MIKEEVLQSSSGKKALSQTLLWLGKRSYTQYEIRQKLQKKAYSEEVIKAVIDYCLTRKYIDDREYARQWISTHNKLKPVGRRRILYELKAKGIDVEIINNCLDELSFEEQEYHLAVCLIKKKIGHNFEEVENKTIRKLYQFLLRRGFSHYIAIKALNDVFKGSSGSLFS